jgi:dipeptidase E
VLGLARAPRPSVCLLATGTGDAAAHVAGFRQAFGALECRPTVLRLFPRELADLRAFVLAQDVIYVGGGSPPNLLAVWRAHGVDAILAEAWAAGVVLCGRSAGACCWFEGCVTDSLGPGRLAAFRDGLGLLPGTLSPHYDVDPSRRPALHREIAGGALPDGWGFDDDAALVFDGTELAEVVATRPGATAHRVARDGAAAAEQALPARVLRG